jgi:PilZ domain
MAFGVCGLHCNSLGWTQFCCSASVGTSVPGQQAAYYNRKESKAMESKKELKALAIVRDLRSGSGSADIMKKYKLSEKGLRSVLRKLVMAKLVLRSEVERFHDVLPELFVGDLRLSMRKRIKFPLLVCDSSDETSKGFVKDISRKGVAIEGFEPEVGEVKGFKVLSSELVETNTFVFEAKCVWKEKPEDDDKEPVAGFEIISISDPALAELEKVLSESTV